MECQVEEENSGAVYGVEMEIIFIVQKTKSMMVKCKLRPSGRIHPCFFDLNFTNTQKCGTFSTHLNFSCLFLS